MNAKLELVQNWLIKAHRDLAAARKLATGPDLYLDVSVYHCQQAAEKAIKGFLVFHDQPFEKTHDIGVLVSLAQRHDAGFSGWFETAARLTPYATEFRYPSVCWSQPLPSLSKHSRRRTACLLLSSLCFPLKCIHKIQRADRC